MSDGYTVDFRDDHILVVLGPDYEVTPENRDRFWRELRSSCEKHDTRRVLVEGPVPGGERDTGDVIAAGLETSAIPDLWLAFHLENFVPDERSELFEVIARNMGVRVRFFATKKDALNWLRHNAPK